MEALGGKSGREIVEEEGPDFKGRIFKTRPRTVVEMLETAVRRYPDREGFVSGDGRLTFREFDGMVKRIAAGLEKQGVRRGDHVALLLGTQIEFPLTFFALMKLGAMVVPLNTRFKGEELAYEINDSGSTVFIVDEDYWSHIAPVRSRLGSVDKIFFNGKSVPEGALPFSMLKENRETAFSQTPLSESDDALIMYTSGTTGRPKGAVLHQRGLVLTAMHATDFLETGPEDKLICCVPLFHITGLAMCMLSHIFCGTACVYMRTFHVRDFLEIMSVERVTQYIGVINIIWLMINHPDFDKYDWASFRKAMFGGSPATEEMVRGILGKLPGLQVSVGYGLTESHAIVSSTPYEDAFRKVGSAGKALPLVDAGIVDEDGKELPLGQPGEIVLRSAKTFKGYWRNPKATRETIVDGWLHTGDIGKLDEEGFLYILDRKKDMINRGGEKVYSLEVENVIFNYPKVLEAAVVGVPDSVFGEAVKAVIALKTGENATEEEIKQFCAEHLADYKIPRFVEFVSSLPRSPAGKVIKEELRYA